MRYITIRECSAGELSCESLKYNQQDIHFCFASLNIKVCIAAGLVVLAGCSALSSKLDHQLRPYLGRNIADVSALLGDPDSERQAPGEMQYIWKVDNRFWVTQEGRATLDLKLNQTLTVTQVGPQEIHVHYVCNLRVMTNAAGVIKSFRASGNEGCQRFVTAFHM